ncbi:MAG: hypothetical protein ACRCUE_08085, partial [Bosea sp. (in: a-proteobacteria)]
MLSDFAEAEDMQRWSLRKVLIWLIFAVVAFGLPWQRTLLHLYLPPALDHMSADPVKREQQLRSAVSRLDNLGNVFPYGRGSIYVELAAIEADRGRHHAAAKLLTRGLQFEPQPVGVRLALVK